MEVNNPMMDQLLVTGAAQPNANPNAKASKDADGPDFDSMVHQRRTADTKAETKTTKDAKQTKSDEAPKTEEEAAEEPAADAQYAIAAAMMFQAQPDTRYTMVVSEDAEALPQQAVEAVEPEREAVIELVETPEAEPENLAGPETEVRSAAADAPREEIAPTQPGTVADAPKPEAREARESEAAPRQAGQAPRTESERVENAPRANRAESAAQRPARADASESETGDARTDDAQAAQETPLFEQVNAPVIKVAEASRPIPLEAEDGVEQLGEELSGILVNSADANRVEVTLTPEHLGKLTIEISRGENGALSVVLHASTERAANLLERGVSGLQSMLAANARNNVQVEVRPAEESQQQFLNPNGQNEQGQEQQQQQRHGERRQEQQSAQDFLQQLRLGLVGGEESTNQ